MKTCPTLPSLPGGACSPDFHRVARRQYRRDTLLSLLLERLVERFYYPRTSKSGEHDDGPFVTVTSCSDIGPDDKGNTCMVTHSTYSTCSCLYPQGLVRHFPNLSKHLKAVYPSWLTPNFREFSPGKVHCPFSRLGDRFERVRCASDPVYT